MGIAQNSTGVTVNAARPEPEILNGSGAPVTWQEMADLLPQIVWVSDARGKTPVYNQRLYEYTGLSADAVQGDGWRQILHPEDLSRCLSTRAESVRNGTEWRCEIRLRRHDGAWRWHLGRAVPQREDSTGAIQRWLGTLTDIDEQKRASDAAMASQQGLLRLMDADLIGICFWNADQGTLDANDTFLTLTGYTRQDLSAGRIPHYLALTPPEYQTAEEERARQVLRTGVTSSWETEFVRKDGSRVPVLVGGVSTTSDNRSGVAFALDLSPEKTAESLLRLVADSLPALIAYVDNQMHYRFANRAFQEWFGTAPEAVIGRPVQEVLGDEIHAHRRPYLEAVMRGEGVRFEGPSYHKTLGTREAEIVYIPDRSPSTGQMRGFVVLVQDITDRKQSVQETERLNRDLQRRVSEFETLLRFNPIALCVAEDPECRYIRGNVAAARLLRTHEERSNLSKSAPPGEAVVSYRVFRPGTEIEIPADDLPMQRAAATGREVRNEEIEIIYPDGSPSVRLLSYATPLFDEAGKVRGALGAFVDVTERARLLEKQSRIAESLQRSLLLVPPPDAYPNLLIEPLYQSARDEAQVGGDFFDVFAVAEGKIALVVGDATGKGLEAATYTAEVKFALRAFLSEHKGSPAAALTRLNDFVSQTARLDAAHLESSFVALAVAVVDFRTGLVVSSVSGMETPFVLRSGGEALAVEAAPSGPMMGIQEGVVYEEREVQLAPNDLLVMCTDGITEARRGQSAEFFGYAGLLTAAREAMERGDSLPTLVQHIAASARAFANGHQQDDVCILSAVYKPSTVNEL